MGLKTFIANWGAEYFSIKEKQMSRERISSLFFFLLALFLFSLNIYYLLQNYGVNEIDITKDFHYHSSGFKAIGYQLTILLGLLIHLVSLRFNNRFAFKFSELGVFISFGAWFGYLVWSWLQRIEIAKIADVNWSSHLLFLDGIIAIMVSFSFAIWFFFKIIFLIAVTWKTIRK